MTQHECKYCARAIVLVENEWVDALADGDDSIWQSTCDSHDTFLANHEPKA